MTGLYIKMFLKSVVVQAVCLIIGCSMPTINTSAKIDRFAKGADVSWLPQMEESGFRFYNDDGLETDCLQILKEHGINAIRLRTWVNPSAHPINGHCNQLETVAIAVRAHNLGFQIMLDFHYSDSWSDPSKQVKPTEWASYSFEQLQTAVYQYTYQVMSNLKAVGATPEWVQIGNEINPGILLPDGASTNMPALAKLINRGYDAVKAVHSNTLVIIHLSWGIDNAGCQWFFDGLKQNNAKYDIIGLSYYPFWEKKPHSEIAGKLTANMNALSLRYDKPIMIVETGGVDTASNETYSMLLDIIARIENVTNAMGLGVFYWEPEGASVWSGYGLSCWGSDGRPTKALDAFR